MLHRNHFTILGVLVACLIGTSAQADLKDFTASLQVSLLGVTLDSGSVTGQVDVAPDGSFDLPASLFVLGGAGTAPGISSYFYTGKNAAGQFAPAGPGFGGAMPMNGSGYFSFGTSRSISVPLFVVGGNFASTSVSGAGGVTGTLAGSLWRTGLATISTTQVTASGTATGSVALAGFDARSGGGDGTLQLVTPIRFTLDGSMGMDGSHGSFGVLTLSFLSVPEPGSALLIAVGLVGLAIVGRPRQRA